MVMPLIKITKEDEQYQSHVDIENLLIGLDDLAPGRLVDNLLRSAQVVPFEVLIYYLRHCEIGLSEKYLEPIFTLFYNWLETALRKNCTLTVFKMQA